MKLLGLFLTVAVFAFVSSQSYNYRWGNVGPWDRLLFREIVNKSSSVFQKVTKDVYYPFKNGYSNTTITCINVTDQLTNGKGGNATLLRGGVGFNYTAVHLKSQRGNGFSFIVDIYGR